MYLMLEWWGYQVMTVICIFISLNLVPAQSVLLSFLLVMYLVSIATADTLTALVGKNYISK